VTNGNENRNGNGDRDTVKRPRAGTVAGAMFLSVLNSVDYIRILSSLDLIRIRSRSASRQVTSVPLNKEGSANCARERVGVAAMHLFYSLNIEHQRLFTPRRAPVISRL